MQRLGEILIQQRAVSAEQVQFALLVQRFKGDVLGGVLREYGFISWDTLLKAVSRQIGWPVLSDLFAVDHNMIRRLSIEQWREFCACPVVLDNGRHAIVCGRTYDLKAMDALQSMFKQEDVLWLLASTSQIYNVLKNTHGIEQGLFHHDLKADDLNEVLDALLSEAVYLGVTDIHLEASIDALEIRWRLDGVLHPVHAMDKRSAIKLVNIVVHRADVAISDFGHIHDAHFNFSYQGRDVDIRVSHLPSLYGSSVVLRILDKGKSVLGLRDLKFNEQSLALIEDDLRKPYGMTLVVGPTGCGKTTTLYAMLNQMKSIHRKIVTVEDPVELRMPLLTQMQVNTKKGIGFSQSVRAFLRHDPNVILIGEIRDAETAKEAVRAALTGHKVLATMHTYQPIEAILRLVDLGIPLIHLAHVLSMVTTQRLVRILCPHCKTTQELNQESLREYERKFCDSTAQVIFKAQGCERCFGGYKGRQVITQVMGLGQETFAMIAQGDFINLQNHYQQSPEPKMVDDLKRLLHEGVIDLDEAVRVIG